MTNPEHDDRPRTTGRRRKLAVAGAVGLAAVLGGGAFLATDRLTGAEERPVATGAEAVLPTASAASQPAASRPAAGPAPSASVRADRAPASPRGKMTTAPAVGKSTQERIKAAREAARKAGHPVQRPVPRAAMAAARDVTVTTSGTLRTDRGTMRVVSGRGDLTGYRELGWVADGGEVVGAARCSQTFRFADQAEPTRKPNLLVCWRTSAAKSVYTVTVDLDGKPSKQKSVAALDAQWAKMG